MRRAIRRVGGMLVTLFLLGLAAWLWPARFGGSTSLVIVSGTSMQPALHTGDVVVVRHASHYAVGDVIAYRVPQGEAGAGGMVIHRVVGFEGDALITQGDNRGGVDSWRPRPGDVLGHRVLLIPESGRLLAVIAGPLMLAAMAGVAVAWYMWPADEADEADEADGQPGDDSPGPPERREPVAVS